MNFLQTTRIGLRLSRQEFARRIGIYPDYIADLEVSDRALPSVWVEAVVQGLGVGPEIVDDYMFEGVKAPDGPLPPPRRFACPIATRFALQTLIAYIAGVNRTLEISEDQYADAVVGLNLFLADDREEDDTAEIRFNRLLKGLQITVLTIVQSCEIDPENGFEKKMDAALPPLARLIESFSDLAVSDPETK